MTSEQEATRTTTGPDVERGFVRTSYGYVHYRTAGSGRPIVMLHANRRSSEMYLGIMRRLAGNNRCLAIDLPGCGGFSDDPGRKMVVEDFATVVREALAELGLREVVALGHAMGAWVSVELTVANPGLVRGLILQNCPYYPSREYKQQRHALRRETLQADETGFPLLLRMEDVQDPSNQLLNRPRRPTQEWVDEENRALVLSGRRFWDGLGTIVDYDMAGALQRIECPTLLMWGKEFAYAQQKQEIASRIRNNRIALIPDADFFLYLDNPEEYYRAVTGFLKELP